MTTSHEEERFVAFLRSAAAEMETLAVPREEIWAAIMAQRQGSRYFPIIENTQQSSLGPPRQNKRSLSAGWLTVPIQWTVPVAAIMLIIGVGIGITVDHRTMKPVSASFARGTAQGRSMPQALPSQVEAAQHFHKVQQFLASLSTANSRGQHIAQIDAKTEAIARNLLSTTELLLHSPMAMDPQRRHLLTDLELVLFDIVQMGPNASPEDRDLIVQSIEHSRLQQQLKSAVSSQNQNGT